MSLRDLGTWAVVLVGASSAAEALDPSRAPSQYVVRRWGVQNLRSNTIYALAQTQDRYIWLGTSTGLVRYDGDRFVVFNAASHPEFGDGGASALSESPDGSLFIGTTSGLVLSYRRGVFTRPAVPPASGAVSSLLAARDGSLWIGTHGRNVQRLKDGTLSATEVPSQAPLAMTEDARGVIWIGTKNRGVSRVERDVTEALTHTVEIIQALCVDRAGTLWIGTPHGLVRVRDGQITRLTQADGLSHENVTAVLEDRHGSLWVGTGGGGLNRLTNGAWSRLDSSFDGLSDDDVRTLLEDHEGNLWVGTANGLNCLSEGPFVTYGRAEGLRDVAVTAVAPGAEGTVWVGTASGQLSRWRDGRELSAVSLAGGRGRDAVLALREMRDGALWMALDSQRLLRLHEGTLTEHTAPAGVTNRTVRALYEDAEGPLFMITGMGFARAAGGAFERALPDGPDTGSERYPRFPHMGLRDSRGALWIADRAGLASFHEGRWTHLGAKSGLPNDRVRSIVEDPEDGGMWAATLGGLAYVKGATVRTATLDQGLPENHLRLVLDDGLGFLWIASAGQIFRIERKELHDVFAGRRARVTPRVFDTSDGLRTTEILLSNNPGFRAPDGRLWFATAKGMAVVDPRRLSADVPPPPVHIEEVRIDDVPVDPQPAVSVKPGRGDIVIRYAGLSYVTPERVRFRYQLDGYDPAFVDAGGRRVAYYTNIPPGQYRFRVSARNGDGRWSPAPAGLELYLAPHFYQTRWFLGLCGASILLAAISVHRVRVRYLKAREKELSARVEDGLTQIKVLRGLLPTCASCKKIRDEGGSWNNMESYIREHSEAHFSHGICPECMVKLYPDAAANMRSQ